MIPLALSQRYLPFRAFCGDRAVVYLCSDRETRMPVALKTLDPKLYTDEPSGELPLKAVRDWIAVGSHPHVVAALFLQQDVDPPHVILDFVEPAPGMPTPSLRCWLTEALDPEAACAIALGIARGMRYSNERVPRLVHGDLRPENVLIGRDLRARVTDFGLGSRRPKLARHWAPERWSGACGVRADIYAFALILLEMLRGSQALPEGNAHEIEDAHRRGQPRDQTQSDSIPAVLRDMLTSCLDPSPDGRPSRWAAVDEWLAAAFRHFSGRDAPPLPDGPTAAREDALMRAWSEQAIAHAMRDRGEHQEALVVYRGVARIARRHSDFALEASAVGHSARMLRVLGKLDAAVRELICAVERRQEIGDSVGQADDLFILGDVYAMQGNTDSSLAALFAAARLFAEAGHRRGIAACRTRMAPILDAVGRKTEAREAESESARIMADLKER